MKTRIFKLPILALSVVTAGFFSFRAVPAGSVRGAVNPPEGASTAWAISTTDTLRANISGGTFEIKDAKPGTYRIIIEAVKPYKNIAKEDVVITEGTPVDIGLIELTKDSSAVKK